MNYRQWSNRKGSVKAILLLAIVVFVTAFIYTGHCKPLGSRSIKVVEVETGAGTEIRPALAKGEGESFSEMVKRLRPYAAVNGTYYDENMKPLGDIVINGKLANRGAYRNAVAITPRGRVDFLHRSSGRLRWAGYRAGIAAGPRLVHGGRITLDPVADGFSRRSLTIRAWRTGIGRTKKGTLLLVVAKESLTLREFAQVMLDQGAVEAMNLDGGGACALYHDGRTLATPSLPMTNILVVYKTGRTR